MVCNSKATEDAITSCKNNGLVPKVVGGLHDYFSSKIKFTNNKKGACLGQPHLIKNMENKFGKCIQNIWSHKTPGTPKFLIVRPNADSEKISAEVQQEY